MGASEKVAATFHPMQVLEVRFEAPTPDDAIEEVFEALDLAGLNIRWVATEPLPPVVGPQLGQKVPAIQGEPE